MERKNFKFELKDASDDGQFQGFVSTTKRDSYDDITEPAAFSKTVKESQGVFPILWFHQPDVPIGLTASLEPQDKGVFFQGRLNLEKQVTRDVHSDMRFGSVNVMSFGFQIIKAEHDHEAGTRVLKEIKLFEISPLTMNFSANDEAFITDVKSFQTLSSDMQSLVSELKEITALLRSNHPADPSGTPVEPPTAADPAYASLRATAEELKRELNLLKGAPS